MSHPEEAYERLMLSFRALGSGLWDYDIDDDRLVCDDRWYQILGIDPAIRTIASVADFQPYIHPDDVDRATEINLDEVTLLIANDARYYNEFRVIRPTGEVRWVRSIACVIRDARTGHRRAVGCITDLADSAGLDRAACGWPMRGASASEASAAVTPIRAAGEAQGASAKLTERERECLAWVSLGKTAEETGQITGRSRRTIEFHINNAVRKLGAANKIHATVIAIREGLL